MKDKKANKATRMKETGKDFLLRVNIRRRELTIPETPVSLMGHF